jgi:heme-degrading monooxygenase HmoA
MFKGGAMHAVLFEVLPSDRGYQRYLELAAALRPQLEQMDGFISVERFCCLSVPGWILSFSLWRDEAALIGWRNHGEHHAAQALGRASVFSDYRLRVADLGRPSPAAGRHVGVWEYPEADAVSNGRVFESLTDSGKRIVLFDIEAAGAEAWQARTGNAPPPSRVLCGPVLRDYGMFERMEAPQTFPPVERR